MIDVENLVFTKVAEALRTEFPNAFVTGEYVDVPAKFPAVTIVEADNSIFERMRTTVIENAVAVMYEVSVYSNKAAGKKTEAKAIMDVADSAFASLGFTRQMRQQVPNLNDARIYRVVSRYQAVIAPGNQQDEYLVYQND